MVECSVVDNCGGETTQTTRKQCCVDDSQGRSYQADGVCSPCIGMQGTNELYVYTNLVKRNKMKHYHEFSSCKEKRNNKDFELLSLFLSY